MEINATFVGQAVAFVIFVALCMKYVWPPLISALEKRQKEIADGLDNAEKAKKNLELAKSNAVDTLRQAKAEAQQIIDEAQKQRSVILDRATEEATSEKLRIVESAKAEIEAATNRAREELRAEVIQMAAAAAEKILDKKLDASTDHQLVKKIVDSL